LPPFSICPKLKFSHRYTSCSNWLLLHGSSQKRTLVIFTFFYIVHETTGPGLALSDSNTLGSRTMLSFSFMEHFLELKSTVTYFNKHGQNFL
jgi:hypothetical protein